MWGSILQKARGPQDQSGIGVLRTSCLSQLHIVASSIVHSPSISSSTSGPMSGTLPHPTSHYYPSNQVASPSKRTHYENANINLSKKSHPTFFFQSHFPIPEWQSGAVLDDREAASDVQPSVGITVAARRARRPRPGRPQVVSRSSEMFPADSRVSGRHWRSRTWVELSFI